MLDFVFPGVTFVLWLVFRITVPSANVEFDFDHHHATFMLLLDKYIAIAKAMALVDLVMAAMARTVVVPAHICIAGAVASLLFMGWLLFSYERYLHARYPRVPTVPGRSSYTPSKYALTLALGISALIFTVVGCVAVLA